MKNADFWDATPCGSLGTDFSEERIASIIRVKTICELRTTRRHIPENDILRDAVSFLSEFLTHYTQKLFS
jgi:hypothetical protein